MPLGNLGGLILLLNDDVARSGLDHGLDIAELVAGDHHESAGIGADLLVLAHGQFDQLITT
jgi:hypothetical protein